jgi:hypothetical protein
MEMFMKGRFHWSNASPSPRLWIVHASAAIPCLGLILFPGWTMLFVWAAWVVILFYIEVIKKMTVSSWLRSVNVFLTGREKQLGGFFKNHL